MHGNLWDDCVVKILDVISLPLVIRWFATVAPRSRLRWFDSHHFDWIRFMWNRLVAVTVFHGQRWG
jgi:formate hydrogenlyase subunit 4